MLIRPGLIEALEYISIYYNKILFVDMDTDSFKPIKVDNDEWSHLYGTIKFSDWIRDFALSPYCDDADKKKFLEFTSTKNLKNLKKPTMLIYNKLIHGEYNKVSMELIPVDEGKFYLFVKNLTKLYGTEYYQSEK